MAGILNQALPEIKKPTLSPHTPSSIAAGMSQFQLLKSKVTSGKLSTCEAKEDDVWTDLTFQTEVSAFLEVA